MVDLIRAFGWHRPDRTPCGQPISVAEAHALLDLSRFGGMSQAKLGSRLRLEKSTVSRLLQQMETRDWIRRSSGVQDGRVKEIRITPEGRKTAATLAQARKKKFSDILSRIPTEKRRSVLEAITLLADATRDGVGIE